MFDGLLVFSQAMQGYSAPGWQVKRANRSFFISGAVGSFLFAVVFVAATIYILLGHVVYYGPTPSGNAELVWQIIDLLVCIGFVIGLAIYAVMRLVSLTSAERQAIVVTPEGFALSTGAEPKSYPYALYSAVSGSISQGTAKITLRRADGKGVDRVTFDGRFGKMEPTVTSIVIGSQQFRKAYATQQAQQRQG